MLANIKTKLYRTKKYTMLAQTVLLLIVSELMVAAAVNLTNVKLEHESTIEIVDLTCQANWKDIALYYGAVEKQWKICYSCGTPGLGTTLHMERPGETTGSMYPAVIPSDYLLTRLQVIDVSHLATLAPYFTLTLDVALQWQAIKRDPAEPTLLLFRFGWKEADSRLIDTKACICKIPGLSYELAEWIVSNLSHVVGVATDAPSLESDQTREFYTRTVSHVLGKSGVYMIENVNMRRRIPEQGCLALAMPLKLQSAHYVPTRLTAFCPPTSEDVHVAMTVQRNTIIARTHENRVYDVNLEEILH